MKNIINSFLFVFLSFCLVGQESGIEEIKNSQSNVVLLNTLIGKSKVGVGVRYKSLYPLNNILKFGWGIGLESYSSKFERSFIPLSFELMGDVFENGRTPFYMVSIGYGIPLKEDVEFAEESRGGIMIDISVGYRSKKKSLQPFIAIGYRVQNAIYKGTDTYGNTNKEVVFKRWSLSTGLMF